MDEIKKHTKEKARPLINLIFEMRNQAASEYLAEQGLDSSEDESDAVMSQYMEQFNERVREEL